MITFIFSVFMMVSAPSVSPASACETYAPNLDGVSVTVCSGEVVSKCDASGNCQGANSAY